MLISIFSMTQNDSALREQQEEQQVQAAFQHLLDTYLASSHRKKTEVITKAFNFAKAAHRGVRRRSGELYIFHPIAVAQVVCEEMGMGSTTICAALLHDVVEDTDYTREDIANLFGEKVANIVEGVTKVSGGIFGDRASMQAETFKKILLTMSDDIRVILVKIADRLHNMRTLDSMPPSRQYKIVGETLYIFAPLADRLGLNRIKTELENLSFKYEHPDDYALIMQELSESQLQRDDAFQEFTPAIRRALDQMGVQYEIKARIKSPYSIWQKMQRKHIPFEEVFDILAIRIIFRPQKRENEIAECYAIYAALTQIYKPHPSRFRDWLSTPKANGYQALHNTFMSHQGKWIEVQIRSDRMDDIAEGGFAAHWKYKDVGGQHDEHELDTWVNSIKEILDDPQPDTLDLLDTIKLNLFASELNVFTPKGEIVTLPQGATVLDFAFAIHSMVGSHCMGAKVNHRLVPMSHRLANGDQIEVLTSRQQTIQPDWINYVTTGKARGRITAALRKMARERRKQGEEMLQAFLTARKLPAGNATNNKLAVFHHFTSPADLFLAIGEGKLVLSDADVLHLQGKNVSKGWGWRRFVPFLKEKAVPSSSDVAAAYTPDFVRGINRKAVLDLTDEVLTHCERCPQCRPIHGDEVVAYITPDEHLELHRRACPVALKRKTSDGNNLVAARWNPAHVTGQLYDIPIHVEGIDAPGMLMSIAQAMGEFPHFVLKAIHLDTDDGIFTGTLTIALTSSADVARVCNRLMHIEQVAKANRVDGF